MYVYPPPDLTLTLELSRIAMVYTEDEMNRVKIIGKVVAVFKYIEKQKLSGTAITGEQNQKEGFGKCEITNLPSPL